MWSVAPQRGGASITVRTYGKSHRGLKRPNNEDAWLVRQLGQGGVLLAVADGVGGGPAGQEASQLALKILDDAVGMEVHDAARLASAVSLANRRIWESGQQNEQLTGMGTTLTSAAIVGSRVYVAHVGDSRAYHVLADHLVRLTVDHSVAGEMEAAGGLTPDEARVHPNRHMLTRALGPDSRVRIDVSEAEWEDGHRLLLCTDGLTTVLSDQDIFDIAQRDSGQSLVDTLIQRALDRGGPDNITVVVAEAKMGDEHGR